jgi:hypothetical protein
MGGNIYDNQNIENFEKPFIMTIFCGEVSRELSTGAEYWKMVSSRRSGGRRGCISMGGDDLALSTVSTAPTTITIPYKYIYTT